MIIILIIIIIVHNNAQQCNNPFPSQNSIHTQSYIHTYTYYTYTLHYPPIHTNLHARSRMRLNINNKYIPILLYNSSIYNCVNNNY